MSGRHLNRSTDGFGQPTDGVHRRFAGTVPRSADSRPSTPDRGKLFMPSQTTRRRTRTFTLVGVTSVAALAAATIGPVGAAAGSVGPVRAGVDLLAACDPDAFDVNGDGVNDIAVGVPGENVGKKKSGVNAGTVTIVYGEDEFSPYGSGGSEVLKSEDVGQESERNDRFGSSVLVADVNGDDCQDLIIGVPGENKRRGRVMVVFGSMSGLAGHQSLHQDSKGVPGKAEKGDSFGAAIAVSGAAGGGLWVASPKEDLGKISNAGLITQFPFGTGGGKLPLGTRSTSRPRPTACQGRGRPTAGSEPCCSARTPSCMWAILGSGSVARARPDRSTRSMPTGIGSLRVTAPAGSWNGRSIRCVPRRDLAVPGLQVARWLSAPRARRSARSWMRAPSPL